MKHANNQHQSFCGSARILCGFLAFLALPASVLAIGVRIPNQDPEANARGNAFAATADNPSAIYYNPAGIAQTQGHDLQIGVLNYLGINTHYDGTAGGSSDTKFEVLPVPEIYYAFSRTNLPVAFGLGVFAPFGLGVKWPEDSGFRSLAIESRLQYLTLNPVIAWKVHPKLSIAMGPTLNYSELKITRGLLSAMDHFEFMGRAHDFGFNAGLLWQINSQWSFGANYRSATTMDYSGTSRYSPTPGPTSAHTTAHVPFPQIASGGISFRPTPHWNIEFDVDWSDWSTLKSTTLKGTGGIFGSDLPPLQFNWHDSWMYQFGVTRTFDNGWFVSAGYYFCTDTASEKNFTPAIPDTELHVGCIGFGQKRDHWHWAIAAQVIAGPAREVNNADANPVTTESPNGKYQLFSPTISFSIGRRF